MAEKSVLDEATCIIKDAFEDAGHEVGGTFARQVAADVLALATQSTRPATAGVRVKPLEWERGIVEWARPLPGIKYVACPSDPHPHWSWWLDGLEGPVDPHKCTNEQAAKAAAQADYERRILSALDTPSVGELVEALRAYDEYEALPTDRGGRNGTKGRAYAKFAALKDAALSRFKKEG